MTKTIGFFGGSFDPIHFGHLNLAVSLFEAHQLDEVLFCPAFCSPFKKGAPPMACPEMRLKMLELVLEDLPKFKILTDELVRKGPSYTIDTIRSIQKEGVSYRLLLSQDALGKFGHWKEPDELIRLAPPLIGARKMEDLALQDLPIRLKEGMTVTRVLEISSTEIRERVKKKLICSHLVPAKALDYIHKHRLYC